ncbi:MAG TPA: hypothetical protein VFQ23_14780 [Anaerolineales bacterium]|nr:hypothetical protein [Anaerolineales bacterium]
MTARVWDVETGKVIFRFDYPDHVTSVAFSPDGKIIAASGGIPETAKTTLWDALTGKELFSLLGHTDMIGQIVFSPDGTRLATASRDGSARIGSMISASTFMGLGMHPHADTAAFCHGLLIGNYLARLITLARACAPTP